MVGWVRPAARLHDVAHALPYVAPFRDDAECIRRLYFPRPRFSVEVAEDLTAPPWRETPARPRATRRRLTSAALR